MQKIILQKQRTITLENNKAEVSMSAADTEAMTTAKVFVWDNNNDPVMSTWYITSIINPAE